MILLEASFDVTAYSQRGLLAYAETTNRQSCKAKLICLHTPHEHVSSEVRPCTSVEHMLRNHGVPYGTSKSLQLQQDRNISSEYNLTHRAQQTEGLSWGRTKQKSHPPDRVSSGPDLNQRSFMLAINSRLALPLAKMISFSRFPAERQED